MTDKTQMLVAQASSLASQGDLTSALHLCQTAQTQDPNNTDSYALLGTLYLKLKHYAAAIEQFIIAAKHKQTDALTYLQLGEAYHGQYEKELAQLGKSAQLHNALAAFQCALSLAPTSAIACFNLGSTLYELGDIEEASQHFKQALLIKTDFQAAAFGLACCMLMQGEYQAGFTAYLARETTPQMRTYIDMMSNQAQIPNLWQGQPLTGKTLLILSEQGFGDTLQFIRFVKPIALQTEKIIVVCPSEIKDLIQSAAGVDEAYSSYDDLLPHDYYCPLLNLPAMLKLSLATLPNEIPYLTIPQRAVTKWQPKIKSNKKLNVGIVWSGNKENSCDYKRSIPFDQLDALWQLEHIQFFSLQKDNASKANTHTELIDLTVDIHDFCDSAAILQHMDLLLSVCTAPAHLAGALGLPVWIMLASSADWRWQQVRADSPWYPTAKLYRQTSAGDWQSVIHQIIQDLKTLS